MSSTRTFIIPARATYGEYDAETNTSKREVTLLSGETVTFLNLNTYAEKHAETDELFVHVEVKRDTPLDEQLLQRFYNGDIEVKHSFTHHAFDELEENLVDALGDEIMDRTMRLQWDVRYLVERAEAAARTAPFNPHGFGYDKNTLIAVAALLDFHVSYQEVESELELKVTIVEGLGAKHYNPCRDEVIEHVPVTVKGEIKADINSIPASEWDAAWSKPEPWSAGDNVEVKPF